MNRTALIKQIATNEGIKQKEAEKYVDAVLNGFVTAIENGEKKIQLLGYLTFEVKEVKEVTRPNPQNREVMITTPAHNKVVVYAGSKLQDLV